MLSEPARQYLLRLARAALVERLAPSGKALPTTGLGEARAPLGAFVSLHGKGGELRGCIGTFAAQATLADTVASMAVAAGTRDTRFTPVTAKELPSLSFEISVLSEPAPIRAEDVVVGTHGLRITRGFARGVLLPQVPVAQKWDREAFLRHTCEKAGLPPDAWKQADVVLEGFTADVFAER